MLSKAGALSNVITSTVMRRRLKNALVRAGLVLLARALSLVPPRLARPVGGALGAAAFRLARRERRIAEEQLRRALRLKEGSGRARLLARGVFVHLGVSAVEACRLLRDPRPPSGVALPGAADAALRRALAEGRGVVFATGHVGNWELMAAALARRGFPITAVAKESYDPGIARAVARARERLGLESIHRSSDGAAAALLRALRRGRVLGLLVDQDTRAPGGFVPFFGSPAFTPTGAAAIALRAGAPLVVGAIRRTPRGDHVVDVERCELPDDPLAATAAITAVLERAIRRHPSQWVWFHERWRTRPGPS